MEFKEFKSIQDLLQAFPDEQTCIDHLTAIRWDGKVISPFDENSKVYVCPKNRYKCSATNKYFNVRTGTIFEDTKMPLQKWFLAIYISSSHKKGISSHQLARDLDITQKSAWFMLHRIRYAMSHPNYKKVMENEVEMDETYLGGKDKNKHLNKRGGGSGRGSIGRNTDDKAPVFGMVERGGEVQAFHVENTKKQLLVPHIDRSVKPDTIVYTDEYYAYQDLGQKYKHYTIKHSLKKYVDGRVHTNTIEGFWSLLKRGIYGIYHQVSKKHLQAYLDEFAFRYNSRQVSTQFRFNVALSTCDRRLKYNNLISNEKH
ncbi:MAG: hypothetical protein QG594_1253 [Bacteroidota bacterium]|jgi:transposase-like protein|nr:hypothetical protein [Bacteroidota bacterium]